MKTILIALALFIYYPTTAQYLDSVFAVAKEKAKKGDIGSANVVMDQLLEKYPSNGDLIKYKANLLAWEQKYDSAILKIYSVKNYHTDIEAQNMITLFLLRNKKYQDAMNQNKQSLALDSSLLETKLLSLDILMALKNYQSCFNLASSIQKQSEKARLLHDQSANKLYNQRISIGHIYTKAGDYSNHRINLQYQINTKSYTSITSINMAQKTTTNNFQLVQEVYKNWKKYGYTYGSFSLSNSSLFPAYSLSAVQFAPVAHATELDLGIRYYKGQQGNYSIVPSIGGAYTINKVVVNYRFYKVWGSQSNGQTNTISIKKNFSKLDDNIRLDMSLGNQFELYNTANTPFKVNSKGISIGATANKSIAPKVKASIGLQYANTIINELVTRNQITSTLSLTYKFKTN